MHGAIKVCIKELLKHGQQYIGIYSIILWAVTVLVLCYKHCGLPDHSVMEDVNKLQIFILSSL